ncbi:MAG: ComF family protein [Deltaproteobacteria bacterium]|nr:MAG: ComF family protein [Deltaproteobacteria bacterium]
MIRKPYCPVCGLPFSVEISSTHLCGDCLTDQHQFHRARATGRYRGLLRDIIHRFKYGGQTFLARPLAQILVAPAMELAHHYDVDLIIPVPLHPKRLRQRGFNQAALLATDLGSALGISVDYSSLKRTRWTDPQTGLSRRQRQMNVKGAFSVARPEKVNARSVLLLDDVITTGETVNQCTRVLRDGGARLVLVVAAARTVAM